MILLAFLCLAGILIGTRLIETSYDVIGIILTVVSLTVLLLAVTTYAGGEKKPNSCQCVECQCSGGR
jgi:hypothetical protein